MKINNFLKYTLMTSAAVAPLVFVVSCSTSNDENNSLPSRTNNFLPGRTDRLPKSYSNYDFSKLEWKNMPYVEATIDKWIDGDTPTVTIHGSHNSHIKNQKVNIRVGGIDTPELHKKNKKTDKIDVLTKGKEFEFAEKGRIFGNKVLPRGTEVRIFTIGNLSYKRIVGSIFYGKNFSKNYSVEIAKTGLTLTFISNPIDALFEGPTKYIFRSIADAYNEARKNKKGIFSDSEDINNIYSNHGTGDLSSVAFYGSDSENKRHHSVYFYTKDL